MALGLKPLLLAYVVVEFAALLVPVWRPLRVGGPAGRTKLHQAALMVGMVLALFQAIFFTLWLERMGLITNYGAGFRIVTTLTLLGATAILIALAWIVDREGLGSGFSVLLLADSSLIARPLGKTSAAIRRTRHVVQRVFHAVLVGATLWMFSPFHLPTDEGSPPTLRW
jgi:preprotein translocase subunit SecY